MPLLTGHAPAALAGALRRVASVSGLLALGAAAFLWLAQGAAQAAAMDCVGRAPARANGPLIVNRAPLVMSPGFPLFSLGIDGGHLRQITRPGRSDVEAFSYGLGVAPNGRSMTVVRDGKILIVNLISGATRSLAPDVRVFPFASPSWSPDGRRIALAYSDTQGGAGVMLINPDGSGRKTLAFDDGTQVSQVTWSRNGRCLVGYDMQANQQQPRIAVVSSNGGAVQSFAVGLDSVFGMQFSADGKRILFAGGNGSHSRAVYSVRPDGSDRRKIVSGTRGAGDPFVLSPDGLYLAYSDSRGALIRAVAGGKPRRVQRGVFVKAWLPRRR
jgi:WD40 repeat protein